MRYRLDAHRLDYINDNLPQPVEEELVSPVVASVFRELVPNYTVREVFATRREEIRQQAAETITKKLAADGIVVQEVMLRDVQLPAEYAQGLEGLLLKEQENDRMGHRDRNPGQTGPHRRASRRSRESPGRPARRGRGASSRAAGQSRVRRHAIYSAAQGEAD